MLRAENKYEKLVDEWILHLFGSVRWADGFTLHTADESVRMQDSEVLCVWMPTSFFRIAIWMSEALTLLQSRTLCLLFLDFLGFNLFFLSRSSGRPSAVSCNCLPHTVQLTVLSPLQSGQWVYALTNADTTKYLMMMLCVCVCVRTRACKCVCALKLIQDGR